jgi:hypothetical protein
VLVVVVPVPGPVSALDCVATMASRCSVPTSGSRMIRFLDDSDLTSDYDISGTRSIGVREYGC